MNININDYLAYLNVATLIVLAIIAFKHYLLTRHRKSKLNQYAKTSRRLRWKMSSLKTSLVKGRVMPFKNTM